MSNCPLAITLLNTIGRLNPVVVTLKLCWFFLCVGFFFFEFLINDDPFFEFGLYLSAIHLLKQEDFFINHLPEPLLVQHEWNSLLFWKKFW